MPDLPHSEKSTFPKIIAFANCAGAARQESASPAAIGTLLKNELGENDNISAIGLAEVVISDLQLDDLQDFESGFQHQSKERFFYPHLDSKLHNHPKAIEKKWKGQHASPRKVSASNQGETIQQGTAALLYAPSNKIEGKLLRPSGHYPFSDLSDQPMHYHGTRDTEPRSVILIRNLELGQGLKIDLAFCQLETTSKEPRVGTRKQIDSSVGAQNRKAQIERLGKLMFERKNKNPVVLMGDFNARPGAAELLHLCKDFGFRQVLPKSAPSTSSYKKNRVSRYSTSKRSAKTTWPSKTEAEQGWPYSHLSHRILIDHAFVHGFDLQEWSFSLQVIPLPNEQKNLRISDHRPIALYVSPIK